MLTKAVLTAVAMTALSTSAMAQGFSGGELTIDVQSFGEGDSPISVNYSGALEYAVTHSISVAGAIGSYDYSLASGNVTNYSLHGILHINNQASVGAFLGSTSYEDESESFVGIEGGYEMNGFDLEGYTAFYDDDDKTSVLGVSGAYRFTDQIAAIGEIGYASIDGDNHNRISAGAEYTFAQGPSLYAELGRVGDVEASTDNTFIGLGASIEFGASRGTTFNRRGVFEALTTGY